MAAGRDALWRDRDFGVFWLVQTLSALGDSFAMVALPLLVLKATGSVGQMGLLTGIAGVGTVVTGLFAGMIVDRVDRRRLLVLCDVARAVLYGAVPVYWLFSPRIWPLYLVMGVASVFSMLFQVGYVTAVANLVDRDQIVRANSRLETTNAIAAVLGPPLAGLITATFGATTAIGLDAVSFAISVLGLSLIRLRVPHTPPEVAMRWRDVRSSFLDGIRFLWRTPVLRALTMLLTVITFLSLGLTDVFIFYVRNQLGQGDQGVGVVLALTGVGTVLGAALTARMRQSLGFGACWLGACVLIGASIAVFGTTGDVVVAAGAGLVYSAGMALGGICSMSLRQMVTPDRLLGRVTAAFWTLHSALGPIGAATLTALVGAFGPRIPLLAVGATFGLIVLAGLCTPIRQRHPERHRIGSVGS
ncbi:MFS transporter [Kutzneria sp. CA-103260]|uniref:MFS transporter n=1 Tax=Kutzneria sp. CA-103260 TaxID=2802641 RepID=UPI001BAA5389|nr:MFS transporter [Kutzneria sp. CA-103260]QUQ67527.1 MFS transporter [Kutzneria sp. CA-103260]